MSDKGRSLPAKASPKFLHLHSSFAVGGKEVRAARLMNALGRDIEHHIVSAVPGEMGAATQISPKINARYPTHFPPLQGKPWPARLHRLALALKPYDLVLTYNWGAMDAVMAHTLFCDALALPALIHHEDGFNEDEAGGLKWQRNWFRRIALGKASGLVVPSEKLEGIALASWYQPLGRVKRIANGINTAAYAKRPRRDALRVIKREGEKWVGTLAGLRAVKQLEALVRAFAPLPEPWQLVICGEGPERDNIEAEAVRLGIRHRVHLPGHVDNPATAVGLFDIFALSSKSEQFPISVVEAMAAGLPVASFDVGDIRTMIAEENVPYIAPSGAPEDLSSMLAMLAHDEVLRAQIGAANKAKARAHYDESAMVDRYKRLYASASGCIL